MRNLVVCCDGTWNTPEQDHDGVPVPTNVVRLYNAVADRDDQGIEQRKYYHSGVGTEGRWWQRLMGGAFGEGLGRNVMSAYHWLGVNYQPGDRIYLFGFSRGAFTVRSLAGMISTCGLLNLSNLREGDTWKQTETVYRQGYRGKTGRSALKPGWEIHLTGSPMADVDVFFLGVWDTVGALGVPAGLALLHGFDDPRRFAFHDTVLSDRVRHARHAVALDEQRANFTPTLWTNGATHADLRQIWFPGVHCDVGGSYPENGLSDGALAWMMDEAAMLHLAFHPGMRRQIKPDFQDVLHNSWQGFFKLLKTQPRSAPELASATGIPLLHRSALDRQADPPVAQVPYRPTVVLPKGHKQELPVFARPLWNDTGIYLEAGATYKFAAKGEWLDQHIKCGPQGVPVWPHLAYVVGSALGLCKKLLRKRAGHKDADFFGTKRVDGLPWFSLVGAIANGGNPTPNGTPASHEIIPLSTGCTHTPRESGYLYCFANDAWEFYGNNRGSVTLVVQRLT